MTDSTHARMRPLRGHDDRRSYAANTRRSMLNTIVLHILCLGLTFVGGTAHGQSRDTKREMSNAWQWSVAPQLVLSVRDQNSGRTYDAEFIVTDPERDVTRVRRRISGDAFGQTTFPRDFIVDWKPGVYRWRVEVDGRAVTSGRFSYSAKDGGSRVTIFE